MTRLTNDMRAAIVTAALAHKFDPIKEKLADTEDALAREAYAAIIPASEIKALKGVPARWLKHNNYVRVSAGGYDAQLELKSEARLPMPTTGFYDRLGSLPHGDLCDRVRAHVENRRAFWEKRTHAYNATTVLLRSVTTLKALRTAWPDGETFYKKFESAVPVSTLPTVQVAKVNEMLGLPPE